MTDQHAPYCTCDLLANLQLRGDIGFPSLGGENRLARMMGDVDIAGKRVLDFSCGIGGNDESVPL